MDDTITIHGQTGIPSVVRLITSPDMKPMNARAEYEDEDESEVSDINEDEVMEACDMEYIDQLELERAQGKAYDLEIVQCGFMGSGHNRRI